jgi:hypothetical protein
MLVTEASLIECIAKELFYLSQSFHLTQPLPCQGRISDCAGAVPVDCGGPPDSRCIRGQRRVGAHCSRSGIQAVAFFSLGLLALLVLSVSLLFAPSCSVIFTIPPSIFHEACLFFPFLFFCHHFERNELINASQHRCWSLQACGAEQLEALIVVHESVMAPLLLQAGTAVVQLAFCVRTHVHTSWCPSQGPVKAWMHGRDWCCGGCCSSCRRRHPMQLL